MSFREYDDYKDSGITWLGEVPAHWELRPLWTLYRRMKRSGFPGEQLLSVYRDYGVIPKASRDDNFNKPSEDLSPYQLVEPSDLVINKMKAWQGSVAVSEYRGIVSPAYHVYKCLHNHDSKYLNYLMRSLRYITGYLSASKGIRVNQWDLEPQRHTRMPLLIPPRDEQMLISTFLDVETKKIDGLVSEQHRLIRLLTEKCRAVISQTVTKGMNPDAAMKPSGAQWLGSVPRHWDVAPLKYISDIKAGVAFKSSDFEETGVPVLRIGDITTEGTVDFSNAKYLPRRFLSKYEDALVKPHDIVMAMTGATIGKAARYTQEAPALLNQRVCIFRAFEPASQPYVWFLLQTSYYAKYLAITAFGGAQPNISDTKLVGVRVPIPPHSEQQAIASHLGPVVEKYSRLRIEAEHAIELLQERRAAVISAAVTGKIDVRNHDLREYA